MVGVCNWIWRKNRSRYDASFRTSVSFSYVSSLILMSYTFRLNPSKVEYHSGSVIPKGGVWSLQGQKVYQAGAPLKNYGVISLRKWWHRNEIER